jgi:hypothetical protein
MTPRERRTIVFGAGAILVVAGLRGLPLVTAHLRGWVEEARGRSRLAMQAEQVVRAAPSLQVELATRAQAMVGLAPLLVATGSAAEAGAALGSELNAIALRHRVAIRQTDVAPDSAAGPFRRVEVRLQAEGDLAGLYGFVRDVEHGPLLLSFTSLRLQTDAPGSPIECLRLDAVVRGWALAQKEGS